MPSRMPMMLFLLLCAGVARAADVARVESVQGTAQVQAAGAWTRVRGGDAVQGGQTLKTFPRSRAKVRLADGSLVTVYPNSNVNLANASATAPSLKLALGKLRCWVTRTAQRSRFEVRTPVAVCSVRGTEFDVTVAPNGMTGVEVLEGLLGVRSASGAGDEVPVAAGERLNVMGDRPVDPALKAEVFGGAGTVRAEVALAMEKDEVQAAAAQEMRLAEYREGKTLVDVSGKRVRLEEYVMRPAPDTFKLVVLNERDDRFDYFYYKGVFNKDLPQDLSVALNDLSGKLGTTAPEYYLTSYEQVYSNTRDSVKDTGTGGHLVRITANADGTYTVVDAADPTHTRTVDGYNATNGAYDPLSDTFDTTRTAAHDLSVYDPVSDTYQSFSAGQTFWKTRFNTYEHAINGVDKQRFLPATGVTNILVGPLDGHWVYPSVDSLGNTIYGEWGVSASASTEPDPGFLHRRLKLEYYDGTFEQYDTYIIDDEGHLASAADFNGITSGAGYKQELLRWNYQQVITATEFQGRKIDLVVEPKILIKSGLLQ